MIILWIKISSICLMLASVETLHGIARTIFIVPKIGNKRAKQYSVISGTRSSRLVPLAVDFCASVILHKSSSGILCSP